ncbi:MAG: hypothetical protein JW881_08010 [Spirochaetales bacterium]|nr:hypothetical protein [Spirochaetales bacterium]
MEEIQKTISKTKLNQIRRDIKTIIVNNSFPLERFISEIDSTFDFHETAGKTFGISITKKEKADIIVKTFSDEKLMKLVKILLSIYDNNGIYSGKKYKMNGIEALIKTLEKEEKEHTDVQVLLKTDIAGSSNLILRYPKKMKRIMSDIKNEIMKICGGRNGKLLTWHGDGGFILFQNTVKESEGVKSTCNQAVLSGIHILHWLCEYNMFNHLLKEPIELKIIIDISLKPGVTRANVLTTKIYNKINDLEKNYTEPGTILIAEFVYSKLPEKFKSFFDLFYISDYPYRSNYYVYTVKVPSL